MISSQFDQELRLGDCRRESEVATLRKHAGVASSVGAGTDVLVRKSSPVRWCWRFRDRLHPVGSRRASAGEKVDSIAKVFAALAFDILSASAVGAPV